MNNTLKTTAVRAGLSILLASAVLFGASHARAAHTNYTHADMCSSSNTGTIFDDGGFGNNNSTSVTLYCPVINADPNGMTGASGRVRGWDGDTGGYAFVCRGVLRNSSSEMIVFVGDAQGPIVPAGYTGPVIIPNSGNGVLNFPGTVTSNDSLVIACDVPPHSSLYNVRVDN